APPGANCPHAARSPTESDRLAALDDRESTPPPTPTSPAGSLVPAPPLAPTSHPRDNSSADTRGKYNTRAARSACHSQRRGLGGRLLYTSGLGRSGDSDGAALHSRGRTPQSLRPGTAVWLAVHARPPSPPAQTSPPPLAAPQAPQTLPSHPQRPSSLCATSLALPLPPILLSPLSELLRSCQYFDMHPAKSRI